MTLYRFNYFGRFQIELRSDAPSPVSAHFNKELKYLKYEEAAALPVLGTVRVLDKVDFSTGPTVFVKDRIFFKDDILFFVHAHSRIKIEAQDDHFTIFIEKSFTPSIAFYITEIFIRLYSALLCVVFMHSSAFQLHQKNYVVNAFGGTGKTNLLLDVLENGGIYFADDMTGMDISNHLLPYPKRINLLDYNFRYKPHLLGKIGKPHYKWLFPIIDFLSLSSNVFFRKIRERISGRLNIRVDYRQITESQAVSGALPVDCFIWMENSAHPGLSEAHPPYFTRRMAACLDIENRASGYIIDFFKIINQNIADLVDKQNTIIHTIAKNNRIIKISKKPGEDSQVYRLIETFGAAI